MDEINKIKELVKWAKEIPGANSFDWYIERLEYFQKELFKYSKFKVGDEVKLLKTPPITDKLNWGWSGYKDILVKGATAIVTEVDHYATHFRYSLEFDTCKKHYFSFYEKDLE